MGPPLSEMGLLRLREGSHAVTHRRPLPVRREDRRDRSPWRFEVCCWCCCHCCGWAGAAVTSVSLLSSSGFPGLDPRGPRQASLKSLRGERVLPHPPSTTPYRDSEEGEREGLSRLRAVCRRAGPRGRGSSSPRDARASPRLHFLAATATTGAASRRQRGAWVRRPAPSSSPLAGRLRECEPLGLHTSPGKSRPWAPRCRSWAPTSWELRLSERCCLFLNLGAVCLSLLPHSSKALRPAVAHSCAVKGHLMRVRGVSDGTVKVCHIFQVLTYFSFTRGENWGFDSESRLLKVIELVRVLLKCVNWISTLIFCPPEPLVFTLCIILAFLFSFFFFALLYWGLGSENTLEPRLKPG